MKNVIKVLALSLVMVMTLGLLVSCFGGPNKDPDKAEDALKDADYEVAHADSEVEALFLGGWYDGCEEVIFAYNEDEEELIYIWYFEEKADAEDAFEDIEEFADDLKELAEEEEEDIDLVVKQSGKMVYVGTKQAVKDAK